MRNILLAGILLLSDILASGNLATLTGIAEQCPLEGGDAVYEARAIVAYLTGVSFDDNELCYLAEERRQEKETLSQPSSILLYPNPTTGQVYWVGTGEQSVQVRVFNALGQVIANLTSTNGYASLDHLPQGLYHIQLLSFENNILATSKLQLVKR